MFSHSFVTDCTKKKIKKKLNRKLCNLIKWTRFYIFKLLVYILFEKGGLTQNLTLI